MEGLQRSGVNKLDGHIALATLATKPMDIEVYSDEGWVKHGQTKISWIRMDLIRTLHLF